MVTRVISGDATEAPEGWTLGTEASDLSIDELVIVMDDITVEWLEWALAAVQPGGCLRIVSSVPWPELEVRMMEGGWATIVPVLSGSTIFGEKSDGDDPAGICAFDDRGTSLAEARR